MNDKDRNLLFKLHVKEINNSIEVIDCTKEGNHYEFCIKKNRIGSFYFGHNQRYEMYGLPLTNAKIIEHLESSYNIKIDKILFKQDNPISIRRYGFC